jgi:anti-anti-sigma regulatory factor
MVFSFFKKQPEKMVARPGVVARPDAATQPGVKGKDAPSSQPPPAKGEGSEDFHPEFSDLGFSKSSLDFQVDTDFDPVDAPAEEAAMLFASGQDSAAQVILENALQKTGPAERLWLMLFDLYRLSGQRSAFESMGIEYARAFEKSPPGWGLESGEAKAGAVSKSGNARFKGDLLGNNEAAFDAMQKALDKSHALHLDMSKVKQVDADGCARFMELLSYARKNKWKVDLLGRESLLLLVKASAETGKSETPATGKGYWFLLFELLQQQGQQEIFEDLAIDYAVTFEESPPSWDAGRVVAPAPPAEETGEVEEVAAEDNVYVLSGDIRSARFADLSDFAQKHDSLLIDCAGLLRIDFVSVGVLLNILMLVRNTGKQIVFRHPNRMVAELFRVIGLTGVASVVFIKY